MVGKVIIISTANLNESSVSLIVYSSGFSTNKSRKSASSEVKYTVFCDVRTRTCQEASKRIVKCRNTRHGALPYSLHFFQGLAKKTSSLSSIYLRIFFNFMLFCSRSPICDSPSLATDKVGSMADMALS